MMHESHRRNTINRIHIRKLTHKDATGEKNSDGNIEPFLVVLKSDFLCQVKKQREHCFQSKEINFHKSEHRHTNNIQHSAAQHSKEMERAMGKKIKSRKIIRYSCVCSTDLQWNIKCKNFLYSKHIYALAHTNGE